MIILKFTKNIQFQKGYNLLFNKNISKNFRDALNNNITYTFYNKSIHSNFRIYSIKCIVVNVKFVVLYVLKTETTRQAASVPLILDQK